MTTPSLVPGAPGTETRIEFPEYTQDDFKHIHLGHVENEVNHLLGLPDGEFHTEDHATVLAQRFKILSEQKPTLFSYLLRYRRGEADDKQLKIYRASIATIKRIKRNPNLMNREIRRFRDTAQRIMTDK